MKPDHFTLPLGFRHELVVDNFAGGGGASTGIQQAIGRPIDIAINHDPEAIALHQANHPETKHYTESVFKVDPEEITGNQPVGLAWFSPDCTHHSKARGSAPKSPRVRGLAWVVVRWARRVKPRVICVENVEELKGWGPLLDNGQPCPERAGMTFRLWLNQIRGAGYVVEHRELRACDFGAPTIRRRLFVVARRDGQPIVWPAPTHGDPKSDAVLSGRLLPWNTAASDCIDWTIPCPSIFTRKKELAINTQRRVARGIDRFVINTDNPFIVPNVVRDDTEPRPTYRQWIRKARASGGTRAEYDRLYGEGSGFIVPLTHQGSDRINSVEEPVRTVTAAHRGEMALVALTMTGPFVIGAGGPARAGEPKGVEKPLGTIMARNHSHVVVPTLQSAALVEAAHGKYDQSGKKRWGCGARDVRQPALTVTASGGNMALVAAFMAQHNTGVVGHSVKKPVSTITANGSQQQLVTSNLVKLRGSCRDGQRVDAPMPTVCAGGTHVAEVRAFLVKYYGQGGQLSAVTDPVHTLTTKARMGLVEVRGSIYRIVDIGMRMLTPRELYRAQGFPESYRIDVLYKGKPLTKTAQVRMCGNSVCPPMARAIVAANFKHERQWMDEPQRIAA